MKPLGSARTLYVIARNGGDSKPQVHLETNAKGDVQYGIRCSGRTLAQARTRAQSEFSLLRKYVRGLERKKEEKE
jgi:hypothetical protein